MALLKFATSRFGYAFKELLKVSNVIADICQGVDRIFVFFYLFVDQRGSGIRIWKVRSPDWFLDLIWNDNHPLFFFFGKR